MISSLKVLEELKCAFVGVVRKIFLDEQDLMEFIW
jgi:hypothetical protein